MKIGLLFRDASLKFIPAKLNHILKNLILNSQIVTTSLVDQVVEGHANDVLAMKEKVEDMWNSSDSKRVRRSVATATGGAPGFSLFADNVGTYLLTLMKILKFGLCHFHRFL